MTHLVNTQERIYEVITYGCTTERFQVQQEVNSEFNLEDVNADLKLLFLKLIYDTLSVKLPRK